MNEEIFSLTPIQSKNNRISLSLRKSKKPRPDLSCRDIGDADTQNSSKQCSQDIRTKIENATPLQLHKTPKINTPMVKIPMTEIKGIRVRSINELRTPMPDVKPNSITDTKSTITSEVIDISSDEGTFQERKDEVKFSQIKTLSTITKTPTRKSRKRTNNTDTKLEKIVRSPRKLTKSTNLKTFSSKYLPASQQSILKYFQSTDGSERMGYYETYDESAVRKGSLSRKLQPINLNQKFTEISDVNLEEPGTPLIGDETRENIPHMDCIVKRPANGIDRADFHDDFEIFIDSLSNGVVSSTQNNQLNVLCTRSEETKDSDQNCSEQNLPQTNHLDSDSAFSSVIQPPIWRIRKRPPLSASQETCTTEKSKDIEVIDLCDSETPKKKMPNNETIAPRSVTSKAYTRRKISKLTPIKKVKKKKKKGDCPPYKIIENTTFAVDAFRYGKIEGVSHYFLTHFHADHYIGLSKKFKMPVYLSEVSAKLVHTFLRTEKQYLRIMEINTPIIINNVEIVAIDANHCPGAFMFVFKFESGLCTLHTGDFRASPQMEEGPTFWNYHIQTIYLDTTYLSSKYIFKSQEESIFDAICAIDDFRKKHIGEKILYIFGTYVIGKERMWTKIADEYNFKVWTDENRRKALDAIGNTEYLKRLVDSPQKADMHIMTLGNCSYDYLSKYIKQFSDFNMILAVRASGWEKNSKAQYRGNINIIGIPYSEHSSYDELRRFVRFLQPSKIISTVPNGSDVSQTSKIPRSWYSNELRIWQMGYQRSITNYVKITGSRKELLPCTSRIINDIEDAKRFDSDEEEMDATFTTDNTPKICGKEIVAAISDWCS